jgi:hypothetical protein
MEEQEQEEETRGYGPWAGFTLVATGFLLAAGAAAWVRPWAATPAAAPPAAPTMPAGAITYQPPLNNAGPFMVHTGGFADWVANWPWWAAWAVPWTFVLVAVTVFACAVAYLIGKPERKHRKAPAPAMAAQPQPVASNGGDIWHPLPGDTDSFSVRALERALRDGDAASPVPR